MPERPHQPWDGFFAEIDAALTAPLRFDCIGGFVVTQLYGLDRPTADVDVIELAPHGTQDELLALAARGGSLARKHQVYLDRVGVAAVPENYEERLSEMFPGAYRYLRLMALDPYDLALSKLERNSQKDRFDFRFLAKRVPLNPETLERRYTEEMRWQMGRPEREDLTLRLWLEIMREDAG